MFIAWLLLAEPVAAQREVRVRLAPIAAQKASDSLWTAQLQARLSEALHRPRIDFIVLSPDTTDARRCDVRAAPVQDSAARANTLNRAAPRVRAETYDVCVSVRDDGGILRANVVVLGSNAERVDAFEAEDAVTSKNPLVGAIVDRLTLGLSKSVRIAILDFPMLGGDSARFSSFRRSLPSMLATGLSLSSRVVLIEGFDAKKWLGDVAETRGGITHPLTALDIGKKLSANYYIMGQYWELDGQMRIDIRCVAIESGEIIATRGINIERIALRDIEERMRRLASELRAAIEIDFIERRTRPRYVAVGGVPPDPNTPENRTMLLGMIRAVSSKLRHYQGDRLRVRESSVNVRDLLVRYHDRWTASAAIEADVLVSLSLDRTVRDQVIVHVEIFDQESPQAPTTIELSRPIAGVDALLNEIVDSLALALPWGSDRPARTSQVSRDQVRYRNPYKELGGRASMGAALRGDSSLFLGVRGGIAVEAGIVWLPFSPHWQVPFTLRFDFLGSIEQGRQQVIGADAFGGLMYNVRPYHTLSPFVGVSGGMLGVIRRSHGDLNYDFSLGVGVLAGVEHSFSGTAKLFAKLEFTRGFSAIAPKRLGERLMGGGRPGALYATIGPRFAF